jgi:hypothetical protein
MTSDVPPEEMALLATGADYGSTHEVPELGLPRIRVSDGPPRPARARRQQPRPSRAGPQPSGHLLPAGSDPRLVLGLTGCASARTWMHAPFGRSTCAPSSSRSGTATRGR